MTRKRWRPVPLPRAATTSQALRRLSCTHPGGKGSIIPFTASYRVVASRLITGALLVCALSVGLAQRATAAVSPESASGSVIAEPRPQLFATMCALYAAGFESDSSPSIDPAFLTLHAQMRALRGPATEALRKYYHEHVLADPGATLSRYVTFALVAGPAPKFELPPRREDLPPDVLVLDGFNQVLANFYQEAQIEQLWHQFQPQYEQDALKMREPLGKIVLTGTGYLRELIRLGPRTFTVCVEPMVGARTDFRNIGDQYIVVINPRLNSFDVIRHAFLHFLLDPLPIRYREKLVSLEPLIRIGGRAPRLPYEDRKDSTSFFTECFVRAVELRVRRLPPAQLADQVNSSELDGYVLVRPLVAALAKFESAEPAMTFYFTDLVRSINVAAEQQRLRTIAFAPASEAETSGAGAGGERRTAANPALDVEAELVQGERMIATRDAASASAAFESVLEKVPSEPRALYGLAVSSVLQGNADRARELFEQVVAAASEPGTAALRPDAASVSWSHVYLGRMHDLAGEREQAIEEYRAALAIADAPEAARTAAQRGIEQAYQPAARNPSPG